MSEKHPTDYFCSYLGGFPYLFKNLFVKGKWEGALSALKHFPGRGESENAHEFCLLHNFLCGQEIYLTLPPPRGGQFW